MNNLFVSLFLFIYPSTSTSNDDDLYKMASLVFAIWNQEVSSQIRRILVLFLVLFWCCSLRWNRSLLLGMNLIIYMRFRGKMIILLLCLPLLTCFSLCSGLFPSCIFVARVLTTSGTMLLVFWGTFMTAGMRCSKKLQITATSFISSTRSILGLLSTFSSAKY